MQKTASLKYIVEDVEIDNNSNRTTNINLKVEIKKIDDSDKIGTYEVAVVTTKINAEEILVRTPEDG